MSSMSQTTTFVNLIKNDRNSEYRYFSSLYMIQWRQVLTLTTITPKHEHLHAKLTSNSFITSGPQTFKVISDAELKSVMVTLIHLVISCPRCTVESQHKQVLPYNMLCQKDNVDS